MFPMQTLYSTRVTRCTLLVSLNTRPLPLPVPPSIDSTTYRKNRKTLRPGKIMADRDRDRDRPYHQLQVHPQKGGGSQGPSTSQVVAVITLLPVSGTLLVLASLTLLGSAIGLIVTTPLFILFSPVIVPAAILLGLAVTGFLSSGAMGLTGLSALSKAVDYLRGMAGGRLVPEHVDQAKRRMQDMVGYAGQKTKETGQMIQGKAQEGGGKS
ncbi:hypothetical protein Ancab_010294 [Ancistrocladus abbreviatus]